MKNGTPTILYTKETREYARHVRYWRDVRGSQVSLFSCLSRMHHVTRVCATSGECQDQPIFVKGKCTVDNGIVMIVCGMCREKGSSSKKNNTESFQVEFAELRLSAELFEGSMVQKVASAILCQEVPFITEEGGVAYREINAMIAGLGREDKMMSVDVGKYKSGGRTGLVFGFLAGGLIRSVERQKKEKCEREDVEEWAFDGKKKKSLFSVRM
jgi:hypothetical protein